MPTYSYRCTQCENAFDVQQAFTDETLSVCPSCGSALRKVFSAVGVTFSGSGFYRTDSRAEKPAKTEAKTEAKPTPSAAASSTGTGSSS